MFKIATITAALLFSSLPASAWGEREQGILTGIAAILFLQNVQLRAEPQPQHNPPVIVRRNPPVIIQDTPQVLCPPGTAEFYVLRYDRSGRSYYLFDGCR